MVAVQFPWEAQCNDEVKAVEAVGAVGAVGEDGTHLTLATN